MLAFHDRAVHALALAVQPLFFLGALALDRALAGARRSPSAALVFYAFALVAILVAGAMDGFVSADIFSRMVEGDPLIETRRMQLDYTFRVNQAFAAIYTVGSCMAIFLWSLAMVRGRAVTEKTRWTGLGWYGLVSAPVLTLALLSGVLRPDVHGFGLIMLAQAIWLVVAGWLLIRSADLELPTPQPA